MGFLSPWLAALFHHISSVLVVLNSARLVRDDSVGLS
jgi:cation transport ATPase